MLPAVVLGAWSGAATAQEPAAYTFEACALRVEAGSIFTRVATPIDPSYVVIGDPEKERYRLDPSPRFAEIFAAADSAAAHYARFVTVDGRADALNQLSMVLMLAGSVGLWLDDPGGWPVKVGWGGIIVGGVAEIAAARARGRFGRAAELYNQTLVRP